MHIVKLEITGKFRGAIIESGSPLNTWAFRASGLPHAVDLALSVNGSLPDMTTDELVNYLQSLNAKQIDVASTVTTTVIFVLQSLVTLLSSFCSMLYQFWNQSTVVPL